MDMNNYLHGPSFNGGQKTSWNGLTNKMVQIAKMAILKRKKGQTISQQIKCELKDISFPLH